VADLEALKETVVSGLAGVGVDKARVLACVESGKFKQKILDDTKEALSFGINGTPSYFINKKFVASELSLEELKLIIEAVNK